MISNTCKYCQDNDIRKKKEIQAPDMPNYQIEFGPGHATLEINHDPSLVVQMDFYDKLRMRQVEMIIAPAISYCPWCGRKL